MNISVLVWLKNQLYLSYEGQMDSLKQILIKWFIKGQNMTKSIITRDSRLIWGFVMIDLWIFFFLIYDIIYLLYSPSKSFQFGEIKNKGLKVVNTPPNSSLSFVKKLSDKVIKLLSLSLLYSSPFFF